MGSIVNFFFPATVTEFFVTAACTPEGINSFASTTGFFCAPAKMANENNREIISIFFITEFYLRGR